MIFICALVGAIAGLAVSLALRSLWGETERAVRRLAAKNNWSNREAYFIVLFVALSFVAGGMAWVLL